MPKTTTLPADSTLASIWQKLHDPDAYVRGVLLALLERDAERAGVRIGISGTGQYPCYQIMRPDGPHGGYLPGERYNDNHTPFTNASISETAWSNKTMCLREVWELFGVVRGWAK